MATTSPKIAIGIGYIGGIKAHSHYSIGDLQPFSNADDLRTDSTTNRPYATFEPDFWLLDGEYKFYSDELPAASWHVGIMGATLSQGDGSFATAPVLTITFDNTYTIDGLTLRFSEYSNDYPDAFDIEFYDSSDVQIGTTVSVTGLDTWEYFLALDVADCKKIIITFNSTNKPYRYLRMAGVDYGLFLVFEGDSIKAASVVEDSNPIAIELPISTFSTTLYSQDAQFSPINPGSDYYALTERQPIIVHEQIGNQSKFIGQFYLDTWKNASDSDITLECFDALGLLDQMTHMGGIWTGAGIQVEDLLNEMLTPIGIAYDLDVSLYGTVILGWLPIATYRENLQQIAFAIGAYVNATRDRPIKIYPTKLASDNPTPDMYVTKSMKSFDQSIELKPLVTGVKLTAHNIIYGYGTITLYDDVLAIGEHTIEFKQPCHGVQVVSGSATITEVGANYCVLNVTAAGAVNVTGQTYIDTRKIYRVDAAGLDGSVTPNVLEITDASLVNSANAAEVAQRVYDYYQQRLKHQIKMFASGVEVEHILQIDTIHGKQLLNIAEHVESDLAMGMIETVDTTGVMI